MVMNNKLGLSSMELIIVVIIGIILLFIVTAVFGNFADRGSSNLDEYFEFDDYDGDGVPSKLDPCPCDHKEDIMAVRYVINSLAFNEEKERAYLLFKEPIHNISARDRSEIITYLSLRNTGLTDNKLLLSDELKSKVVFTGETPDTRLFCYNDKRGPNGMCSPGDFQRDFLQLQEDSLSLYDSNTNYETICLTPRQECDVLIYNSYQEESLEEDSLEDELLKGKSS